MSVRVLSCGLSRRVRFPKMMWDVRTLVSCDPAVIAREIMARPETLGRFP